MLLGGAEDHVLLGGAEGRVLLGSHPVASTLGHVCS